MTYPKISQKISDPANENIQKLAALFPSAVKDGELDIEVLKQELGQFNEVGPEKYELTWAGKQEAKQNSFKPILGKTLKYIPEDSKHSDTTENLFIEGDNLEALKLLRQNYYGAVKMIYIDPPYNTGNDFIYNDNFKMPKKESDIAEGDISEFGDRYTKNRKDQNRYHANWLNMMYPRLKLAQALLKEDGVILVSISDFEVSNLLTIMDEIFGAANRVAIFSWKSRAKPTNAGNAKYRPQKVAEYIVVYGRRPGDEMTFNVISSKERAYPHEDDKGKYRLTTILTSNRGTFRRETMRFTSGGFTPDENSRWKAGQKVIDELFKCDYIVFNDDKVPMEKKYKHDEQDPLYPIYTFMDEILTGTAETGKADLNEVVGNQHGLDTVKPVQLIKYLIATFSCSEDIVVDFFAGSCTTAQAIVEINLEENTKRRYVLIQISEPINKNSEAFRAGFSDITEIGKKRIREVGKKILEKNKDKESINNLDVGFKVFRIGDTNINWLHQDLKGGDLFDHYDKNASDKDKLDFTPDFTDMDVVYEIILRQTDIPLSSKVEQLTDIGARTYIFADSFLVCLEQNITRELVDLLAAIEPLPVKFVFRDSAFDDDIALKDETFRTLSALIERNSGGEKQTYTVEFI